MNDALIASMEDLCMLDPWGRTKAGRELGIALEALIRKRWHAQNAKVARMLSGKIRARAFYKNRHPLIDHDEAIWTKRDGVWCPLAVVSHVYTCFTLNPPDPVRGFVARKLTLISGWYPGACEVYVLMHRDAPEWAALKAVLA